MILEEETFEAYGYYSRDLTSQSHKPIIAACDDCNKPRILKKYSYHALCNSCAGKDRNFHHGAPFYGLEGPWG